MLFGKKRSEKGLPDLPPLSGAFGIGRGTILPFADSEEPEDKSLPAFPNSPSHNKFSQAAIKEAVGEPEEEELPEFPEMSAVDREKNTVEMEEWIPNIETKSEPAAEVDFEELNILPPPAQSLPTRRTSIQKPTRFISEEGPSSRISDVFVKIDKYHTAKRALDAIFEKLEEIDNLVKKIRETKLREEQELSTWERDVAHIKARIQEVTENIFEKVD